MTFRERIKRIRLELGLTLDDVSKEVGVSRQTIQRYESGVISNIPSENVEKLAIALKTTPAKLMGWDNENAVPLIGSSGLKIKERRIRVGLSVEQLASKLNKSRATIYRYESSEYENMPLGMLKDLSIALGTTPAELIGWQSNSTTNDLLESYIGKPKRVRDEISSRIEKLDSVFTINVCKLLKESGDINGFLKQTGLDFNIVGEFMQGKPVKISAEQAESIATFFHTDIVNMFFDTGNVIDSKKKRGEDYNY